MQHIILAVYWICFGIVHSVFAAEPVKVFFMNSMKQNFKYYRLCYSVIAAIMVVFILYYNFSINTIQLWHASSIERILACISGLGGLIVMCICIYKYFFDLSGISVFFKKKTEDRLQVDGLNKYVRHPLYSSTLLFAWSFFFCQPVLSNLISCLMISIYTIIGAYFEERKLLKTFGEEYKEYVSKVPMIIPKFV
jgi:protein-S-isoprenylcysteine O-methyltransferase Ste14